MPLMRAKMRVTGVQKNPDSETITMTAVPKSDGYPDDGTDENNTFAKFTPSADLKITIANPNLVGKIELNREFYLDFRAA